MLRCRYVTLIWSLAFTSCPTAGLSPSDYGWRQNGEIIQPILFEDQEMPTRLFLNSNIASITNDTADGENESESHLRSSDE
jgi:hypothetical protein